MFIFNKCFVCLCVMLLVGIMGLVMMVFGVFGFGCDLLLDFYLFLVFNFVIMEMFYEGVDLCNECYIDFLCGIFLLEQYYVMYMLLWLCFDGFMCIVFVLGVVELVKIFCDQYCYDYVEDMVDGVFQCVDELGEFLVYWFLIVGKVWLKCYMVVCNGIVCVVVCFYNEFMYGKLDFECWVYWFVDVIEIVYLKLKDVVQFDLFCFIIDCCYKCLGCLIENLLMMLVLKEWCVFVQFDLVNLCLFQQDFVKWVGLVWEDVLLELGSRVSKKVLWEVVMYIMVLYVLLKNLCNFDEYGIFDEVVDCVLVILLDGE